MTRRCTVWLTHRCSPITNTMPVAFLLRIPLKKRKKSTSPQAVLLSRRILASGSVVVVRPSSEAATEDMTRPGSGRSFDVDLHQELGQGQQRLPLSRELVGDANVASLVKKVETQLTAEIPYWNLPKPIALANTHSSQESPLNGLKVVPDASCERGPNN